MRLSGERIKAAATVTLATPVAGRRGHSREWFKRVDAGTAFIVVAVIFGVESIPEPSTYAMMGEFDVHRTPKLA